MGPGAKFTPCAAEDNDSGGADGPVELGGAVFHPAEIKQFSAAPCPAGELNSFIVVLATKWQNA